MPFQYRITKYNPNNRDITGTYLKDEWTSYGDINKSYSGKKLSYDEYINTENKYIQSILQFMTCNQITFLRINCLEKKNNPKHDMNNTTKMTNVFEKVKNGDLISMDMVDPLCRLIFRDYLWCKLENDHAMQVHFGTDYYMYIVSSSCCNNIIKNIKLDGLFVEIYKSPYYINDAFINSLNIFNGIIMYNEFDIDEDWSLQDQKNSLIGDLLQIKFDNDVLIDVGWGPVFNPQGCFIVKIIKHYDWQDPVDIFKAKTLKTLKKAIENAASIIIHRDL